MAISFLKVMTSFSKCCKNECNEYLAINIYHSTNNYLTLSACQLEKFAAKKVSKRKSFLLTSKRNQLFSHFQIFNEKLQHFQTKNVINLLLFFLYIRLLILITIKQEKMSSLFIRDLRKR